jgi:hypothetical protein
MVRCTDTMRALLGSHVADLLQRHATQCCRSGSQLQVLALLVLLTQNLRLSPILVLLCLVTAVLQRRQTYKQHI